MKDLERLKSKTILLVEDELVIRNNIASMLKFFFKNVYTAINGYDGLEQYENYLPDIIMTDLKMPHMDGFELIQELKSRSCQSYLIIVSAHTDTELLIDAIHKGVDRYIVKPIIEEDLFSTFEAFLEKDKITHTKIELNDALWIDFNQSEIVNENQVFHLNKKELLLLKLLCSNMNKIFTYEEIEYQVWTEQSMSLSALRSVVRDLRKKLGQEFIVNISSTGYRLK